MSKHRSTAKRLIITDDEQVEAEDQDQIQNPFSFREFLRWKNQDPDLDQDPDPDPDLDQDPDQDHEQNFSKRLLDVDPEVSSSFLSESSLQEEEWGRSLQSGADTDEEEETRFSSTAEGAGRGENYEGDDETSMAEAVASCRRRSGRSSQIQQLTQENQALRRSIKELQRRSEATERRVEELTEELFQRRRQEEKEAKDLESMVHSVEQNLQQMTKRAVRSESCVSRLKAELQQLQSENEALRTAESEVVVTMRHNAQVASEYLNKMAGHAHSSLQKLMGEAEVLVLVSQLLQSIDKISVLDSES